MPNALAQATSPYLLQHQDNPVDWREWSAAALAEAQARDVPILLSVGYAACHWCHVMAHESFEDPAVAARMNRDFLNIKVDREERPDLDQVYQQALALLGQQGGWPLTMFLTPAGEPFWGGTYFPPDARYGRAGFPQVLEQLANLWRHERPKLDGNRAQLQAAMQRLARPSAGPVLDAEVALAAARSLARRIDPVHGGLGGAPKFPQAPAMDLLWRAAVATGDKVIAARVTHTLRKICQGGIYDHLGGGFARYSTDAYWLVPHFEKMLYDNAQLLRQLAAAWTATGEPLFKARIEETVTWLGREMVVDGAFAAALDADTEGEEGRFYVWGEPEIRGLLGADVDTFAMAYGVVGAGNFEGHNVLNRLHEPGLPPAQDEPLLARCRATLLAARETRPRPARDDKLLADWNGLLVHGLVEAALALGRADWLATAEAAFAAVLGRMADGPKLVHAWRAGRSGSQAFLDDYAQLARAALALHEATGQPAYLERAAAWVAVCDAEFADGEGGFFQTAAGADPLVVRPVAIHDGPVTAAAAMLAEVSLMLFQLTGEARHEARADGLLRAAAGDVREHPDGHAGLLSAALLAAQPIQVVLVGPADDPAMAALTQAVRQAVLPNRILSRVADPAALPPAHPAAGKAMLGGRATAYLCIGRVCQAPVTEPAALATALRAAALLG